MKNLKNIISKVFIVLATLLLIPSCTFEEQVDPNGASLEGVLSNASVNQLNNMVVSVQSTMRNALGVDITSSGSLARELYIFDADPRNTEVLLGKNGSVIGNSDFYSTAPWGGRYRAIKNANVLIQSVGNTSSVTDAQKSGYVGFAKTMIAYELIQVLKLYGKARVDVSDENNLGPVLDFDPAMDAIRNMLDDGLSDLNNAGASFSFTLAGFSDFNTPTTFTKFNRAVAALAAIYDGDKAGARTALTASYFDLTASLNLGPKYVFSNSSGDSTNPIFKVPSGTTVASAQNGDQLVVHNDWINDAESGDTRVATKTGVRPDATSQDGLNGTHEIRLYASNISSIPILRNEELILLYAEAQIGNDNTLAINALNVIRNAAGLPNYSGATTDTALVTELLNQRRYSLWAEGHRMFDLRRYNLSNTLPADRTGDVVYNIMPIPFTETQN